MKSSLVYILGRYSSTITAHVSRLMLGLLDQITLCVYEIKHVEGADGQRDCISDGIRLFQRVGRG